MYSTFMFVMLVMWIILVLIDWILLYMRRGRWKRIDYWKIPIDLVVLALYIWNAFY